LLDTGLSQKAKRAQRKTAVVLELLNLKLRDDLGPREMRRKIDLLEELQRLRESD
jgi:hypothetical protein